MEDKGGTKRGRRGHLGKTRRRNKSARRRRRKHEKGYEEEEVGEDCENEGENNRRAWRRTRRRMRTRTWVRRRRASRGLDSRRLSARGRRHEPAGSPERGSLCVSAKTPSETHSGLRATAVHWEPQRGQLCWPSGGCRSMGGSRGSRAKSGAKGRPECHSLSKRLLQDQIWTLPGQVLALQWYCAGTAPGLHWHCTST